MAKPDFKKLFASFPSARIGVIGDMMLDSYWWGNVERISPEAPVPVVTVERREQRIGGAGNVALNLASLGASVTVFSMLGEDEDGRVLTELMRPAKIRTDYLIYSSDRLTTNKMRVISRNQQMMRLDTESVHALSATEEQRLLEQVDKYLDVVKPHAMILEDYNKGVLTEKVIRQVVRSCRRKGIVTAVDPKRKNFFQYKDVDIFKPNLKEAREALNLLPQEVTTEFLRDIHRKLHAQLKHRISFITLSEKGVFYEDALHARLVPSHIRKVADVSGAGDTVIAVATLVFALTGNQQLMAEMANIAGGLVCESVGTVAIDRSLLLKECQRLIKQ